MLQYGPATIGPKHKSSTASWKFFAESDFSVSLLLDQSSGRVLSEFSVA